MLVGSLFNGGHRVKDACFLISFRNKFFEDCFLYRIIVFIYLIVHKDFSFNLFACFIKNQQFNYFIARLRNSKKM